MAYHCYIPNAVNQSDGFTFLKSLYFSTVTITTLGYGDITPKSDLAMMIVASEAIFGIVIIGLFLNSLASQIEDKQDAAIKKRLSEQNFHRLISFYKYLLSVITNYKITLNELTTPINNRQDLPKEPNPDFNFSDLQDIFKPSILRKNGYNKPVIHHYYEKLDLLLIELKFLLANFDLNEYPVIHEIVIAFLATSEQEDPRDALYSCETTKADGELLKDSLENMIKQYDDCPDIKTCGDVIHPVAMLDNIVRIQIKLIKLLEREFEQLMKPFTKSDVQ